MIGWDAPSYWDPPYNILPYRIEGWKLQGRLAEQLELLQDTLWQDM